MILEFNQYLKSVKVASIIYTDLESLIKKLDARENNHENSSTTKVAENIPSGFSSSTISSFKSIKNKHGVYRDENCMKNFCKSLKEHAMEIINFERNPLCK